MIFSEIYNCYFQSVSAIIKEAVEGGLTGKRMTEIIQQTAFSESFFTIESALRMEEWPLLTKDWKTPIKHIPGQPLTSLQLRWMKSLLEDPKIHLFSPDTAGLEEVEPLFTPDMFVYYDRYQDADPYQDPKYITCFQQVLSALRQKKGLQILYCGRTGKKHAIRGLPKYLEYSSKDDKFRLKMISEENIPKKEKKKIVCYLKDERNALTRAMFQFSYLEKETEQLSEGNYRITIYYDKNDENELLIQILAFGSSIYVSEPCELKEKIKIRLERQMQLMKKT